MADSITRRVAAGLVATAAAASPAGAGDLAPFAWDRRVLVVFAAMEGAALREQRDLLAGARPDLEERDITVLAVIGPDRVEALLGSTRGATPAALRGRFRVPPEQPFAAVLVGKDGGEKWRADRPAAPEELFALIDAMPMRRHEAEEGG